MDRRSGPASGEESVSLSPIPARHRIIFIGTDRDDGKRIHATFARSGTNVHLEFADSSEAVIGVMKRETVDAIFVNEARSAITVFDFLRTLTAMNRQVPVISMLRSVDDAAVLRALRDGAHDCVAADQGSFDTYPAVALRTIARAETALEGSERARAVIRGQKQWMSIIDAITDLIFVIDSKQTIVKVNNAFAMVIGRHPRSIVGHQIREVFGLDVPNETLLLDVLREGAPRTYEKKVGEEIYQVSIFPLQEDNRPLTIHVMKNITEVRRLKDQLYHADRLASIGLLVSGVAHEINNPLTGAIGYTELLAMTVTDVKIKAELQKILDSAERCKKIVDNLLTFSRQQTPTKSLESVNDIIDRAVDLRSYCLKSSNIEIVKDYDPLSTVFADAQQLQQAFLNLLLNAEQAIGDAGQTNGRIRFATRYDKNARRVAILVSDNGPGIPQKIAARIFDPFFTTKPVGVGTGLGLSIAHGIITEHGGTIWHENIEGWGASFRVELPTGTDKLANADALRAGENENRE